MMDEFNRFRQQMQGVNPQQKMNELLQSGKVNQQQIDQANQEAQTAELLRRLGKDCPVNAVVVQPNTPVSFPTNCCGQFNGGGWGNGCGNGCG